MKVIKERKTLIYSYGAQDYQQLIKYMEIT